MLSGKCRVLLMFARADAPGPSDCSGGDGCVQHLCTLTEGETSAQFSTTNLTFYQEPVTKILRITEELVVTVQRFREYFSKTSIINSNPIDYDYDVS